MIIIIILEMDIYLLGRTISLTSFHQILDIVTRCCGTQATCMSLRV